MEKWQKLCEWQIPQIFRGKKVGNVWWWRRAVSPNTRSVFFEWWRRRPGLPLKFASGYDRAPWGLSGLGSGPCGLVRFCGSQTCALPIVIKNFEKNWKFDQIACHFFMPTTVVTRLRKKNAQMAIPLYFCTF